MRRFVTPAFDPTPVDSSRGKRERDQQPQSCSAFGVGAETATTCGGRGIVPQPTTHGHRRVVTERPPILSGTMGATTISPGGSQSSHPGSVLGITPGTSSPLSSSSSPTAHLPEEILRSLGLTKLQQDMLFSKKEAVVSSSNSAMAGVNGKKNTKINPGPRRWCAEEDYRLLEEVMTHGTRWTHISRLHEPHRDPQALSQRWSFVESLLLVQQQQSGGDVDGSSSSSGRLSNSHNIHHPSDPLAQLIPLKSVLQSWHLNHGRGLGGTRADTRKVVHAQVMQRVEQLTSGGGSGGGGITGASSGGSCSSRSAANVHHGGGAGSSSGPPSTVSSMSGARPMSLSSSHVYPASLGGDSPDHSDAGDTGSSPFSSSGGDDISIGGGSADFPESLEDFNHLFPKPSAEVQAAAQTATLFTAPRSETNPTTTIPPTGAERLLASIEDGNVEDFVNDLVKKEFNQPDQSHAISEGTEAMDTGKPTVSIPVPPKEEPPAATSPREMIEPLLCVLEGVDVECLQHLSPQPSPVVVTATSKPKEVVVNQHSWNPTAEANGITRELATSTIPPPSAASSGSGGSGSAGGPPSMIHNSSPVASSVELNNTNGPAQPTASAAAGGAAAGVGGTAFMSAWLNLQNNGLNFNSPIWTSVSEQPRCMWKSMMPRLIVYLPLPWVHSVSQQLNVLIPSASALPFPSNFTMAAAAVQHGVRPPTVLSSNNSECIKKEKQEAKMFGSVQASSADPPAVCPVGGHTICGGGEVRRSKPRICPYSILFGHVQSMLPSPPTTPVAPPSAGVI